MLNFPKHFPPNGTGELVPFQNIKQMKIEHVTEENSPATSPTNNNVNNIINKPHHRDPPTRKAKLKAREASQQQAKDSQYLSSEIHDLEPPKRRGGMNSAKPAVDFSKLDVAALKRYKKTYHLRTRQNQTKVELISSVTKHFGTLPVNETGIIENFFRTINQQQFDDENLVSLLCSWQLNPNKWLKFLKNYQNFLKKNGEILFRDYGLYDMTQARFISKENRKLGDRYYVRADGRTIYYFI